MVRSLTSVLVLGADVWTVCQDFRETCFVVLTRLFLALHQIVAESIIHRSRLLYLNVIGTLT